MSGKSKTALLGKNFKGIIDRTDSTELSGNVRVYHFPAGGTGSGIVNTDTLLGTDFVI